MYHKLLFFSCLLLCSCAADEPLTEFQTAIPLAQPTPTAHILSYIDSLEKKIVSTTTTRDSLMANQLYEQGKSYYKAKDYDRAIAHFLKMQEIQTAIYAQSHPDIAKIEQILGQAYVKNKADDEALIHFQNAVDLRIAYKDVKLYRTYYQLANLYLNRNEYELAAKYFQLNINQRPDTSGQSHYSLALAKSELQELEAAMEHLKIALSVYRKDSISYIEKIVKCYNLKGTIRDDQKKYKAALEAYQQVVDICLKMEDADFTPLLFNAYNNMGISHRKLQEYLAATQVLNKAMALKVPTGESATRFHNAAYINLGDVYLEQKKYDKALNVYQKAIQTMFEPALSITTTEKINLNAHQIVGFKPHLLEVLAAKAKALEGFYRKNQKLVFLETAIHTWQTTFELIDEMRQEQLEEISKLFWREKTRPMYEQAIEVAAQSNDPALAFDFFEKSKAALLFDALKSETASRFIPKDIATAEKELLAQIADQEQALQEGENATLQLQKIVSLKEKHQKLVVQLEQDFPKYYDYKYNTQVASLAQIQQQLAKDNSTLVEYQFIGDLIYALVIQGNKAQIYPLEKPANFDAQIAQFLQFIAHKNALATNAAFAEYSQLAHSLYQTLIAPLQLSTERVVFIPDGLLNYIPFEALVEQPTAEPTAYLLQKHTISYAYSATVLLQNQQNKQNANGKILAIAPMEFPNHNLAPLTLGEAEVDDILTILKGKKQIGKQAQLSNFEEAATPYSVLHLSTHASASDEKMGTPWIAFYDSLLFLQEIYHLNLKADLVVLSACETSTGDLRAGEGVMSLARSFAYAGVPATVTSLWEVNERATAELMSLFYQNLQQQDKATALRQAKLQYLEAHPFASPYTWAAFIPIGDMAALAYLE